MCLGEGRDARTAIRDCKKQTTSVTCQRGAACYNIMYSSSTDRVIVDRNCSDPSVYTCEGGVCLYAVANKGGVSMANTLCTVRNSDILRSKLAAKVYSKEYYFCHPLFPQKSFDLGEP